MLPQAFQPGEIRDSNDNIVRPGAYGKNTPLVDPQNTGILDYIINNFDAIYVLANKGNNAYQVAVANGFAGTEQEWLETLVGPVGPQGPPGECELPIASNTVLGGVKIGNDLEINSVGVLKLKSQVEQCENKGENYIRYKSGLQICWGYDAAAQDESTAQEINFALPFYFPPAMSAGNPPVGCGSITNTSFKLYWTSMAQPLYFGNVSWVAIGRWK